MGRHHSSMGLRYCSVPVNLRCSDHVPLPVNRGSICTLSAHAFEHIFKALERRCSGDMLRPFVCFYPGQLFLAAIFSGSARYSRSPKASYHRITSSLGATPIFSGCYLLPLAVALSITSILTGIVIRKTGRYRPIIISGMVMMTLGTGLFIDLPYNVGAHSSWARIVLFQIIFGLGVGPNFQAPLIALQSLVNVSFSHGSTSKRYRRLLGVGHGISMLHCSTASLQRF